MVKKLSLIILIIQFLCIPVKAQNNDRWVAGSGKQLNGKVVSLICFISTPENPWLISEKEIALAKIDEGEQWLIKQANTYNADLRINHISLNNGKDIKFDVIEPGKASGKERVDWVYRTMEKLGYSNSKQAYRKLKKKHRADNIHVMLLAKGKGRSYSMRFAKGLNKKKYMLEGVIIYNEYLNGAQTPLHAIYAHELLHIYGAWDLYKTYAQSLERQQKATELFPNDIMLRVDHNINPLEINDLTAWLIGWNQSEEEVFEWFRPSDYSK